MQEGIRQRVGRALDLIELQTEDFDILVVKNAIGRARMILPTSLYFWHRVWSIEGRL